LFILHEVNTEWKLHSVSKHGYIMILFILHKVITQWEVNTNYTVEITHKLHWEVNTGLHIVHTTQGKYEVGSKH